MKLFFRYIVPISIVFILFSLAGCIKEDGDDCYQELEVSLYSKSPCETDTIYPAGIKDVTLCVFDKNDILSAYVRKEGIILRKGYSEVLKLTSQGLYTVVAWSGMNASHLELNGLELGKTKKDDLIFRLKRLQGVVAFMNAKQIYFGESRAIYAGDETSGSLVKVPVNLQEVTNRLTISVEGLDENAGEYEVYIEADNGAMRLDGTIAKDEVVKYNPIASSDGGQLTAEFSLLKLETGHNITIVIRNATTGKELYRGSLLGTLLLKNPEVDLNCDHDFTIRFTTQDQCDCGIYVIHEIWVNNWLVHSYDTEL